MRPPLSATNAMRLNCREGEVENSVAVIRMPTQLLGPMVFDRTFEPPEATLRSRTRRSGGGNAGHQEFYVHARRIEAGATITVTNGDSAAHTVSASNGSFDVTVKGRAQVALTAPMKPGTYAFVCNIHPTMRGQLTVSK